MRHPRRSLFVLIGCLVLLQAADFCLTWALLASGIRGDVYEANPLANYILTRYGWAGLASFKSVCSMVALGAILLISRHRAVAGSRLLVVLCLVMGGVVGYSGALLSAPTDKGDEHLVALRRESHQISYSLVALSRLDVYRSAICRDLLDARIDLPTAIERMRNCITHFAPVVHPSSRIDFPNVENPSSLAGYIYFHFHATRLLNKHPDLEPKLGLLARETKERFPKITLVDVRTKHQQVKSDFRPAAGVARR